MTETVWITRHGNRQDFVDSEWFKTAERPHDPPLSEDGLVQARETAWRLASEPISHIFSSPFLRCVETANEIATLLNLPISIEWGLAEWMNVEWFSGVPETLAWPLLIQRFPRIDTGYHSSNSISFPENRLQMRRRTADTARRLVEQSSGPLLIVGHGASVTGSVAGLLEKAPEEDDFESVLPEIPCCCLVKLRRREQTWRLELCADTAHLSQRVAGSRFR